MRMTPICCLFIVSLALVGASPERPGSSQNSKSKIPLCQSALQGLLRSASRCLPRSASRSLPRSASRSLPRSASRGLPRRAPQNVPQSAPTPEVDTTEVMRILYLQKYRGTFKAFDVDHDGVISEEDVNKFYDREKNERKYLSAEWTNENLDDACKQLLGRIQLYEKMELENFASYMSLKDKGTLTEEDMEFIKGKKNLPIIYLVNKWKVDSNPLMQSSGKTSTSDQWRF